jgi:hypothetical protein
VKYYPPCSLPSSSSDITTNNNKHTFSNVLNLVGESDKRSDLACWNILCGGCSSSNGLERNSLGVALVKEDLLIPADPGARETVELGLAIGDSNSLAGIHRIVVPDLIRMLCLGLALDQVRSKGDKKNNSNTLTACVHG